MTTNLPPRLLDLTDPELRANPYPTYRWYRENSPVHRIEPRQAGSVPRYLLTRWDDVEAGLKNPVLKRENHSTALWNQPLDEVPQPLRTYALMTREWPIFRDPPNHTPARRPFNRVLDKGYVSNSIALLTNILQKTLVDLEKCGHFDAAEDFARRVVLQLNLAMLGIQNHNWKELGDHLQSISAGLGNFFDSSRLEKASHAMETIEEWIQEAVQNHLTSPDQEVAPFLSRLLTMKNDGLISGRSQLAATAIFLIQAGQDTTSALLANSILTLLHYPVYIAKLIEEPNFVPHVIEEVLRYESPVQQITRHPSEPIEIRGVTVQVGEAVSFLLGAANRDPVVFENPDDFNPTSLRPKTAAFGFGPHGCPGATFARETVAAALRAFFLRFPNTQLTNEKISWKPLVSFRSVTELFVKLG